MNKSEYKILLWLSGVTRETFWDRADEKMHDGIMTDNYNMEKAAHRLRSMGFLIEINKGYDDNILYFFITKAEATEQNISGAIARMAAFAACETLD